MQKFARWVAKNQKSVRSAVVFIWCGCGTYVFLNMGLSPWIVIPLVLILQFFYGMVISTAPMYLQQIALKKLQEECDPYPYLQEIREQRSYPNNVTVSQLLVINEAMALRNIGEYGQAFTLLSNTNIDKSAGTASATKVVYYNNLTDLCALMGKFQEANIWYTKTSQIFSDMRPGKQKEQLRSTVEDNRALHHFCNGEYDLALDVLGQAKLENLSGRVENAMLYARTYLAMGQPEKAVKPLEFVAERGNKLYFATEARELLAKIDILEEE